MLLLIWKMSSAWVKSFIWRTENLFVVEKKNQINLKFRIIFLLKPIEYVCSLHWINIVFLINCIMRCVHCENIYAHIISLTAIWTSNTQGSKQILFFMCILMRSLDSILKGNSALNKIDSSNVKNMPKICLSDTEGSFQILHRVLL